MNKRGVSPLIATVLLIAFAVSLGAVVMNWTAASHGIDAHADAVCEEVSITILNNGADKAICFDRDAKRILVDFENGKHDIDGLRLSYIGSDSNFVDYNKKIDAGVLSHVELEYDVQQYGELRLVRITPFVRTTVNTYCTDKSERFSAIEDCT